MSERTAEELTEVIRAGTLDRQGLYEETACYKCYDADDKLIYVGVTKNTVQRWSQHRKTSGWWRQVARHEITWYDSRPKALFAERLTVIAVLRESKTPRPEDEAEHACVWAVGFAGRVGWSKYQIATELGIPVPEASGLMLAARRARYY